MMSLRAIWTMCHALQGACKFVCLPIVLCCVAFMWPRDFCARLTSRSRQAAAAVAGPEAWVAAVVAARTPETHLVHENI